ncbi:ABC transporter ATP-binding protein [Terrihabitans soli]|uniref:ABC transporter ATP-binding protein n=1 Tax=Terrihabitans soli TaxID=708113 RepID=A0A6S6QXV4_9HYPH|nr:ATP-binding cassette domain-containing protein [Terrihabitans soli]BCJ91861.1 ABC transporter ATP-binding protein [Terrihabitans soli]
MHGALSILPLRIRGLGLARNGRDLLSGVSADLLPGAPSVILGPNGAGKSLFLKLCHGLIAPTSGTIEWSAPAARAHAMVLQRPVLLRRSGRANVVHALALQGLSSTERANRADEVLERFGLTSIAARPARVLSGGEQQRLAIARAFALAPQVLFLDEPTSALDPGATRAVEEMIGTIAREGTKIVMATHDLGQARRLAGDVLFFHGGRLVEQTSASAFFGKPQTDEAGAFLRGDLLW